MYLMWPFNSFAVASVFLGVICLPRRFVLADDPLYETTFVVGPEPQPLVFETVKSPSSSVRPLDSKIGGRKLNEHEKYNTDMKSTLQRKPNSAHQARSDIGINSARRSVQEDDSCSITNTILGFNYTDTFIADTAALITADPSGAAGVSRLVSVMRSVIEVYQKNGNLMFRDNFQSFFSDFPEALEPGTRTVSPSVIYDEHAGRFVVVVSQRGISTEVSRFWLAVSKSETPDTIDDWHKTFINTALTIDGGIVEASSPGLEVDEEAVYVTGNLYPFSSSALKGVRVWVITKGVDGGFYGGGEPSLYIADPFTAGGRNAGMVPTQIHGAGGVDGSVGTFLVSLLIFSTGRIRLQIVTLFNPLSANPTFTFQTVSLGYISGSNANTLPDATQLGTSREVDTNDIKVNDAVWRDNKLWLVFAINPRTGANKGQATVHWVRLGTSGGTVTFEAQGDLGGESIAAGTHTYYSSVDVNSRGLVAYGYGASSPTTYIGAYASVGTSEQAYTVQSGVAPYNRTRSGLNRWGTSSGISVDPTDDSFWVFNQYAYTVGSVDENGDGRWGSAWGRLACTTAPAPSPVSTPSPAQYPCGLFGFNLFCPLTACGSLGRLLGLCHRTNS